MRPASARSLSTRPASISFVHADPWSRRAFLGGLGAVLLVDVPLAWAVKYGQIAQPEQFNSVGRVWVIQARQLPDGSWERAASLGTGTLLTPDVVLTAAHVVRPARSPVHIVFELDGQNLMAHGVAYRTHPDFDAAYPAADCRADLALVRLNRSFPADLNYFPLATAAPAAGTLLTCVGYGKDESQTTNIRRFGTLRVLQDQDGMIACVPGDERGQMTDGGDSGGPLLVSAGGKDQPPEAREISCLTQSRAIVDVEGLARSVGLDATDLGAYVPVAALRTWIENQMRQLASLTVPVEPPTYLAREALPEEPAALDALGLERLLGSASAVAECVQTVCQAGLNEPLERAIPQQLAGKMARQAVIQWRKRAIRPLTLKELQSSLLRAGASQQEAWVAEVAKRGLWGGIGSEEIDRLLAAGVDAETVQTLRGQLR